MAACLALLFAAYPFLPLKLAGYQNGIYINKPVPWLGHCVSPSHRMVGMAQPNVSAGLILVHTT